MIIYPDKAHVDMRAWRSKGSYRRAWPLEISAPPKGVPQCKNCTDLSYVYVAFIKAGPFQSVPALKLHQALKWYDGDPGAGMGWYIVDKMCAYECPMCMGASRVADPDPEPLPEWQPPLRKDLM